MTRADPWGNLADGAPNVIGRRGVAGDADEPAIVARDTAAPPAGAPSRKLGTCLSTTHPLPAAVDKPDLRWDLDAPLAVDKEPV